MKTTLLATIATVVAITAACMGGGPVDVSEAETRLAAGDLPGASESWEGLLAANPDSPEVLTGVAHDKLLSGDWDGADAALARAQELTGDADGAFRLRRALVGLQSGDPDRLDAVKRHAAESGRPEGKLLAAEVHLVDAEVDDALTLLKEIRTTPGAVGETAERYLALLESGNVFEPALAEATALWSVGRREVACSSAEEVLKALPDTDEKSELLLLWAGRAATSGHPGVAAGLLDELNVLGAPPGQEWRVRATRAMVMVADGQIEEALAMFAALETLAAEGAVPFQGLQDARATASALAERPADAAAIAGSVESVAAARGLYQAGAGRYAKDAVPAGSAFATFLESR
jgi:tetratricopeptide (TPR) repeat protein